MSFLQPAAEESATDWGLVGAATGLALLGIFTAWAKFRPAVAPRTAPAWTGLNRFLADKWYIDSAYQWVATHVILGASAVFAWVDRHVVNGFVDGTAWLAGRVGVALRRVETGQLQFYALIIFAGAVIAGLVLAALAAGGPMP
jgi:NADH-quinone oxidoreductase subunit L